MKRSGLLLDSRSLVILNMHDIQIETINRLLKKQTRTRGKKGTIAAVEADEEGDQEGEDTIVSAVPPAIPTLFRWVSSSKPDSPIMSFSVPPALMPETDALQALQGVSPPPTKVTPLCDISGCSLPRKYKLVKDPSKGGCGMDHLKALQVA